MQVCPGGEVGGGGVRVRVVANHRQFAYRSPPGLPLDLRRQRAGVTTDEPSRKRTKGRGVRTVDTIAGGGSSSKRSSVRVFVVGCDMATITGGNGRLCL